MTYQVSRNGQMYGPYTLEDLRRYVASGNILPTDMAKGEDMPDWLPVAQILGTQGIASAPAPAYAAPAAYPQPTGSAYPDPPNLNWGLELLLGFLTCTIFVVVWNLVLAAWANRIQPASKALMYYVAATVLIVLNYGGSWGILVAMAHHGIRIAAFLAVWSVSPAGSFASSLVLLCAIRWSSTSTDLSRLACASAP